MSVGEYALDTRAAVAALRARPEVTTIGILGHSMGAAGSLVATAQDPDVAAVIAVAAPADPHRLTRQTFRLAKLPIPGVLAWPLAWLTTRVYLQPARPHGRLDQRDPRRPRDPGAGDARPRHGRRRRPRAPTSAGSRPPGAAPGRRP